MVVFGGLGFVSPLLKPWYEHASDIGYIFLAIAAVCITANSVFAASSNQSRYLLARFKLERLLADFRLNVVAAELGANGPIVSDEQLRDIVDSTKMFLSAVFDAEIRETGEWSKEVQGAIDALSKRIESAGKKVGG
jgi:hypothetical protein